LAVGLRERLFLRMGGIVSVILVNELRKCMEITLFVPEYAVLKENKRAVSTR
jgi:hypothetical protein